MNGWMQADTSRQKPGAITGSQISTDGILPVKSNRIQRVWRLIAFAKGEYICHRKCLRVIRRADRQFGGLGVMEWLMH
jgi:hypothetical protein